MTSSKKLIEVALPLEAINRACAREKSIRQGHPSTLHLWWARRPLAAARAVIFAQMVDDPSAYVDVLRADPKLHRKAETALKARLKLWEEARALAERAKGTGLSVPEPGPAPTLDEMLADHGAPAALPHHRRPGAVGEHHQRDGAAGGARRDLAELAAGLRRERRPSTGEGAVRPQEAARLPRPVRRRRRAAAGGAAARARELRQRPEPGGGADQQGDDRDPAEVRGQAAGEPEARKDKSLSSRRNGRARRASPRTCATTASGCATRPRSASATSTRRSRSPPRWRRRGRT